MAAQGLHVVTLDLLGHGRSDRPADPLVYSMTAFAEQVVALLDHLGAEQAVVGGTSLGANVVARDRGPRAGAGRAGCCWRCRSSTTPSRPGSSRSGRSVRRRASALHRHGPAQRDPAGPARARAVLGGHRARHRRPAAPTPMAAVVHGIFFGRLAPSSSQRRADQPRRPWSSATRSTRSTRSPTPPCWPRRCPTRASCAPAASSSGASGPSASTDRGGRLRALECWRPRASLGPPDARP